MLSAFWGWRNWGCRSNLIIWLNYVTGAAEASNIAHPSWLMLLQRESSWASALKSRLFTSFAGYSGLHCGPRNSFSWGRSIGFHNSFFRASMLAADCLPYSCKKKAIFLKGIKWKLFLHIAETCNHFSHLNQLLSRIERYHCARMIVVCCGEEHAFAVHHLDEIN